MQKLISFIFFVLLFPNINAQSISTTAKILGKIIDDSNQPISEARIYTSDNETNASTNTTGDFAIEVQANKNIKIIVQAFGFQKKVLQYNLQVNENKKVIIVLEKIKEKQKAAEVRAVKVKNEISTITIDPKNAEIMPSTVGGIEGMIKVFLNSNNELTSQYNVRGGNYDENLVYVNDFEINRPFLVRSGQQEGLSFINADLVQNVNFSTGGFQAKYGDKMSSVLDVKYRRPKEFAASVGISLLGGSAHIEGTNKKNSFTYMLGLRQKTNQYLLQAQPTQGVYNPTFTDIQTNILYDVNSKWQVELLANYARNRFNFTPTKISESFGLINKVLNLTMFYSGSEKDQFDNNFAGISFINKPNTKLTLKYLISGYRSNEYETYDLQGEYILGEVESDLGKDNFGQIKYALGTGIIHSNARNYLFTTMINAGHRGTYNTKRHFWQWGANAEQVTIFDKLNEWERRDSAGYTQPFNDSQIIISKKFKADYDFDYQRYHAFIQDNISFDSIGLTLNAGVRANFNSLNSELIISPRLQASFKPKKWKNNFFFKGATGLYQQPPLYRELRSLSGSLNTNVLAQKSWHNVLGAEYHFKAWGRPFKFITEAYYKQMWDVVPYEVDNVRIRYFGRNAATAFAYGLEARMFGEIVKGAESWLSMNIMKTSELVQGELLKVYDSAGNYIGDVPAGYIPRPTDSRFNIGMFFQDYVPNHKNYKVHLNATYSTGLPFGPPNNYRSDDILRIPSYKRIDMGFSALLVDGDSKNRPYYSFFHNVKSLWLTAEVYNLLGVQNTISYLWIQDQTTQKTYAVPNRLTARLLNLRLVAKF